MIQKKKQQVNIDRIRAEAQLKLDWLTKTIVDRNSNEATVDDYEATFDWEDDMYMCPFTETLMPSEFW